MFAYFLKHTLDRINCVRFSPSGDMLASASSDGTVQVVDLRIEKEPHADGTSDGSNRELSSSFILLEY